MDAKSYGEEYKTNSSPNYAVGSRRFITAMGSALLLVLANIAAMWYLARTEVADLMVWSYTDAFGAPFLGLVVFGAALTAGRYFGLKSIANDNLGFAAVMVLLVEVVYAIFGAGVLSLYAPSLWSNALAVTFVAVAVYTLLVVGVVYSTDHSFESWGEYSGALMMIGLLDVLAYTLFSWSSFMWLGFGTITVGFALDLVYEVWHTSGSNRSALANGFAVYIAFMGVFVHVLQLALKIMAPGDG